MTQLIETKELAFVSGLVSGKTDGLDKIQIERNFERASRRTHTSGPPYRGPAARFHGGYAFPGGCGHKGKEENSMKEIPQPEQRLCRIHGIAIAPSRWRSGHRHTDCARCRNAHASKRRNNAERSYARSMELRRWYLAGRMRGIRLFERITGMRTGITGITW